MQLIIQVISSQPGSLRNRIVNDNKLKKFGFTVVEKKKVGRPHGWANFIARNPIVMVPSILNGVGGPRC